MKAPPGDGLKVVAGLGARASRVGQTVILSSERAQDEWRPSWGLVVTWKNGKRAVEVGYGLVNGVEPMVNNLVISGREVKSKDSVTFERPAVDLPAEGDSEGRVWLCLQTEVSESGGLLAEKVTVIATAIKPMMAGDAAGDNPLIGWHPLGLVRNEVELHQITMFDLTYRAVKDSRGRWRHFFW
jgi:hypothetical protein